MVGKLIADLITTGHCEPSIDAFRIDRFNNAE